MPEIAAERREFYQRLDAKSSAPLWEVLGRIIPPEPQPYCVAALWRYQELRPLLMEAGQLITAKEAERRVLMLENPGVRGASRITQSLYAGLQLVMPGEITSVHRHTATAIRFIIEGEGAYTAVNGERATMHPGDFILTPSWTSHDHGNPSRTPVVWLDGLDVPIVNLFDASFAGPAPQEAEVDAPNLVFAYPYASSRKAVEAASVDPHHGARVQYTHPLGYPMPTMAAFLQRLPNGFRGKPSSSDGRDRILRRRRPGRHSYRGQTLRMERARCLRGPLLVQPLPRSPPGVRAVQLLRSPRSTSSGPMERRITLRGFFP